jgi:hypothetical protein
VPSQAVRRAQKLRREQFWQRRSSRLKHFDVVKNGHLIGNPNEDFAKYSDRYSLRQL